MSTILLILIIITLISLIFFTVFVLRGAKKSYKKEYDELVLPIKEAILHGTTFSLNYPSDPINSDVSPSDNENTTESIEI